MIAPPGLQLCASNRLEVLAERLAARMRNAPGEPHAAERIVVPHPTLGRWLRLALASELGIAANLRIELPAEFAWATMRDTVPTLAREQPFAPASLRWRIEAQLKGWQGDDPLGRYLRAEAESASQPSAASALLERRRYALADRLAVVYDRCLLYRPDWIRAWQRGETPHWQARLWQLLTDDAEEPAHWVDAIDAFMAAVAGAQENANASTGGGSGQLELALAPSAPARPRASFFGIVGLSPTYLDVLRCAAQLMDVHLYMLSPCREFWADTRSARERAAASRARGDDAGTTEASPRPGLAAPPLGNELLSLWGRPARDMQALLADELGVGDPLEIYRDADASTRLGAVQQDILELRSAEDAASGSDIAEDDDSLQIHVCHTAMREAEVLHDRLLAIFDANPDIQPADVLILTPALEDYAPAIESVFAAADTIPVDVGRRRRRDNAAVQAFLDILALPGSRYGSRAVLTPLRARSVQLRFGIDEESLHTLRGGLERAGIRWGIDAAHLAALGMPDTASHTWRKGIRRLLLGYAVGDDTATVQGIVACPLGRAGFDVGAGEYAQLGGLLRYLEQLFALAAWVDEERSPSGWAESLRTDVLAAFFADLPGVSEVDAVAALIDEFEQECRLADRAAPISFEALRSAIAALGDTAMRSVARLADGATLGRLASGEIFPAKVVCLAGMNDRAFPRYQSETSFDPMAEDGRRIGDRDLRDEDRFAFLEALLAARRFFVVTYTGRDVREDSAIPASIVVNELAEHLAARFPNWAQEGCETVHPLQPFSSRYFDGASRLFSFSQAMADAASATAGEGAAPRALRGILPEAETPLRTGEVALDDLLRFAARPVQFFVEKRLHMTLRLEEDDLRDDETLALDGLQTWQLRNRLLALGEAGISEAAAAPIALSKGELQESNLGRVECRERGFEVAQLAAALAPFRGHLDAPLQDVEAQVGDICVSGAVAGYHAERRELVSYRVGALRPIDFIDAWLRLLCVSCTVEQQARAVLLGVTDELQRREIQGPAPSAAQCALAHWLRAWEQGWRTPLPFFPKTSWEWATSVPDEAHRAWNGNAFGEARDPYNRLAFPEGPFGNEAFETLAEELLAPLAAALA